jgi:hypothetical protein
VSGREAIVTLVACVLLVFEAVPGPVLWFAVLTGVGGPSYPLYIALALIGGGVLGLVLRRQGGVSIPARQERGASRGALAGLVVGEVSSSGSTLAWWAPACWWGSPSAGPSMGPQFTQARRRDLLRSSHQGFLGR